MYQGRRGGVGEEDSNGRTALMVMLDTAVWEYNLQTHIDTYLRIAKWLLKPGSNVNAVSADAMT